MLDNVLVKFVMHQNARFIVSVTKGFRKQRRSVIRDDALSQELAHDERNGNLGPFGLERKADSTPEISQH